MTYEGLLNVFKVDPSNPASASLQWFVDNEDPITKETKILAAGANTYARVSPLLPGGITTNFKNPDDGLNHNHLIYTWLYTPPVGVKKGFPVDQQQIYKLWGALMTQATKVTEAGYGGTLHSFRTVPSSCEFPDYDPQSRGLIAKVVHRIIWTMPTTT